MREAAKVETCRVGVRGASDCQRARSGGDFLWAGLQNHELIVEARIIPDTPSVKRGSSSRRGLAARRAAK